MNADLPFFTFGTVTGAESTLDHGFGATRMNPILPFTFDTDTFGTVTDAESTLFHDVVATEMNAESYRGFTHASSYLSSIET